MRCPKCDHDNDADAEFCVNCGVNLRKTLSGGSDTPKGMDTSVKILIIITAIVLVLGIGLVSGMLLMQNQANPITNTSVNDSTADVSQPTTQANQNSPQYKTFSNSVINFQYPSSWDVLPNNANSMVIVGISSYPGFSVYDESKYGFTSLSESVSSSKSGKTKEGDIIMSEHSTTVDGLPAHEIIFKGKTVVQQIVLVEKSPGSQYFALVGADNVNHFDQSRSTFDQIINTFEFRS
jgi:cytoskeletal protein RodZ